MTVFRPPIDGLEGIVTSSLTDCDIKQEIWFVSIIHRVFTTGFYTFSIETLWGPSKW